MLFIQRPMVEALDDEDPRHQRFAIGPLDPGFGYTLGVSLRRVLLSSIPGAAITEVRFDETLHEFSTIPGVKEDVSDIMLNLKEVVLRSESDDPVVVRIDVRGPAQVTARDIQVTSDVECVDPDIYIATVDERGRLAADLTVERGKGYLPVDRPKGSTPIGVLPLDGIFSPVRRVAYEVQPTRVEQSTNFDRLVLDIETDGSISPRAALASAGETIGNLMGLISSLTEDSSGLAFGDLVHGGGSSPDMDLPIEELDLSERPRNCLKRAQINTIGELIKRTEDELLNLTNFGDKSLQEVIERLDERGLSLRMRGV